jgi:hypothetical protein
MLDGVGSYSVTPFYPLGCLCLDQVKYGYFCITVIGHKCEN